MGDIANMDKWHEEFTAISKEFEEPDRKLEYFIPWYYDYEIYDDKIMPPYDIFIRIKSNDIERRDVIMTRMQPLFACQPKLVTVCQESKNHFIRSSFKYYKLKKNDDSSDEEFHNEIENFKYTISLCGYNLTSLNLTGYLFSDLMPLIKTNCLNVETLELKFKEMKDEHFEDVFNNMSYLRILTIKLEGGGIPTIPIALINSLKEVGGTLKYLHLSAHMSQTNYTFLPDEMADAFTKLTVLEKLEICNFDQNQVIFESIGKMKSLIYIILSFNALMKDPNFNKKYDMYPIGNLKNLKKLCIDMDYGVTDDFLINLCNNAKKLVHLIIVGTHITDTGMVAFNRLTKLGFLFLSLRQYEKKNEFLTDKSVSLLLNKNLSNLDITNCINITNETVKKFAINLPKLNFLYVENTSVNNNIASEIAELQFPKYREVSLLVYVSFPIDPRDKLLCESKNVVFSTPELNNL